MSKEQVTEGQIREGQGPGHGRPGSPHALLFKLYNWHVILVSGVQYSD